MLILGVLAVLAVLPVLWWYRRRGRDEMFTGITPGELPGLGHQVGRTRVPGREYAGTVAVRFTPPDGVTPGLAGTVIDGRADSADLGATIVDLAVRGHLTVTALPKQSADPAPAGADPATARTTDYLLRRVQPPPVGDELRPYEQTLLDGLFAGPHADDHTGAAVRMSELGPDFAQRMREAQVGLYREVVERGWYREHPRIVGRRFGCVTGVLAILAAIVLVAVVWQLRREGEASLVGLLLPLGVATAGVLLFRGARTRSARTAEGTAVRIQTMGFREYLTKAEASQIRFEEARDVFSRFLPFAVVFGVADRWARLFAEVAAHAHAAGIADAYFDLSWFDVDLSGLELLGDGLDLLTDGVGGVGDLAHTLSGPDGLAELADLGGLGSLGDVGDLVGTLGETLGGFADGVGGFVSGIGDLASLGDGCDVGGCDGCDLGGCAP